MVTINTDDPAMFDATLAGEYAVLQEHFGMDDATVERLSLAVIDASWADEATRSRLRSDIRQWWANR